MTTKREESLKLENGIDMIGTIRAVLESGNSVELNATGYSMFPTLRPGDRVVVRPLVKGELPIPGEIVVCVDNGAMEESIDSILVMHRLIAIKEDDSGEIIFITRGDSRLENDEPWTKPQMIGKAVSFKRGKKVHSITKFVSEDWRYQINRRLLSGFNLRNRLIHFYGEKLRRRQH